MTPAGSAGDLRAAAMRIFRRVGHAHYIF